MQMLGMMCYMEHSQQQNRCKEFVVQLSASNVEQALYAHVGNQGEFISCMALPKQSRRAPASGIRPGARSTRGALSCPSSRHCNGLQRTRKVHLSSTLSSSG